MDRYFVLGNPIEQSRSPFIHQHFAMQTNQALEYGKLLVGLDEFNHTITQLMQSGVKGVNVTMPFKEEALRLCDELSPAAKLAGAVNTLSFIDGKILGDNSDGPGLVQDLLNQNVALKNKKILLMGAGGAARGVIFPLLEQKPEQLVIANRTLSKAENLVKEFNASHFCAIPFSETENQAFDVIINATSTSLSAELPPISGNCITQNTVCYDMVYSKQQTRFLAWCQEQGAKQCIDGLGMLVNQAAVSFHIWRKVNPDTQPVLNKLRAQLK